MGFKAILAGKPNRQKFMNILEDEMYYVGELPLQDFELITDTWWNQPNFFIEVTSEKNVIETFVGVISHWTKGQPAEPEDIFMFNTRGTSIRHALMSSDFSPKSKKGLIGGFVGNGELLRVSKDIIQPGIEAREHEQTVAKKEAKPMARKIQAALLHAAVETGWRF